MPKKMKRSAGKWSERTTDRRGTKSYRYKRLLGGLRRHRKILGKRLREARKAAGKSQTDVGYHFAQDHTLISKIESGKRAVEFGELEEFARLYQQPLEFFATQREAPASKTRPRR